MVDRVREFYVYPDVGTQLQELLRRWLDGGAYGDIPDEKAFAGAVSTDVQVINGGPTPVCRVQRASAAGAGRADGR
jgi:hypothetical protein